MSFWLRSITLLVCLLAETAFARPLIVYERGDCPPNLHPMLLGSSQEGVRLSGLISERVSRLNPRNNRLELNLFSTVETRSATRYDLTLKPEARWSTGEPLTAADVENSFKRLQNLTASKNGETARSLLNTMALVERFEALENGKVMVVFRLPVQMEEVTSWIAMLPVVPAKLSDEDLSKPGFQTAGPFILTERKGNTLFLKANPQYHLGAPKIKSMEIRYSSGNEQEALLANEGQSEIITRVSSSKLLSIKKNATFTIRPVNTRRIVYLGFNRVLGSIFELKPELRSAVASFIDRQGIIDALKEVGGGGPLLTGPFGYSSIYNDPEVEPIPYSLTVAASRLSDLGYRRVGDNYRSETGQTLRMRILIYDGVQNYELIGSLLKEQLEREGIPVEQKIVSRPELLKLLREPSGSFDMILHEWILDEGEEIFDIYHSNGTLNYLRYANRALDERLNLERRAALQKSRLLYRQEMHRIMSRDLPAVFLWQAQDYAAIREDVANIPPLDGYFFFADIHLWSLEGDDEQSLVIPPDQQSLGG